MPTPGRVVRPRGLAAGVGKQRPYNANPLAFAIFAIFCEKVPRSRNLRGRSGEQVLDHVAVDVGQAEVAALGAVGEALMIEAEAV